MRLLLITAGLLTLSGCSLLMPTPDPNRAWIDLHTDSRSDIAAMKVDGKEWPSSRYFEVDPGQHELGVRYQFQVDPTNIGSGTPSALWRDCRLTVKYPDFSSGQRYRLETGAIGFRPWAKLYDAQAKVIARGKEQGCDGAQPDSTADSDGPAHEGLRFKWPSWLPRLSGKGETGQDMQQ